MDVVKGGISSIMDAVWPFSKFNVALGRINTFRPTKFYSIGWEELEFTTCLRNQFLSILSTLNAVNVHWGSAGW